ncbi:hypothetical protein D3C78_1199660 [compost metagenome]
MPYRDQASREQFNRRLAGGEQREALRGFDSNRAAERARARDSLTQRGITAPATSNLQARERAQQATRDLRDNPQTRERAQAATRKLQDNPQARQRAQSAVQHRGGEQQLRQRSQNNSQIRQQARQQHTKVQAPRNNAFAGARSPSQSRALANRGQVSRAAASRPQAARAGHPVQRPARAPSRGGAHRRG